MKCLKCQVFWGGNTDLDPRLDVVPIRLQTVKSAERV